MQTKKEFNKDKVIKAEITRLRKIFKDIEDDKKKDVLEGVLQEAAFMRATLEELKLIISETGVIDEMPQGTYSILREHPAVKTYNAMIQRYTTVTKQLLDLLPKTVAKEIGDDFEDFINAK